MASTNSLICFLRITFNKFYRVVALLKSKLFWLRLGLALQGFTQFYCNKSFYHTRYDTI